jgi:hypothetical protein
MSAINKITKIFSCFLLVGQFRHFQDEDKETKKMWDGGGKRPNLGL